VAKRLGDWATGVATVWPFVLSVAL